MAVKALIGLALVVAIALGVLLPVPHGANNRAEANSTLPGLQLDRG